MSAHEEALIGGNVTTVVKVGDTVRRTPGPWTPTIQRLLVHARAKGVHWVPEPLGFDEVGREVLSFIAGDVPHHMPEWVWSEQALTDVACALRQWHDATVGFAVCDPSWNLSTPGPHEVICHNDFAPYNCVFREGRFVGAIDFDLCAPGSRLWDIAYTAYRFVPLMPGPDVTAPPGERSPFSKSMTGARLELFLNSYGRADATTRYNPAQLIAVTIERLHAIAAWTEDHAHRNGVTALEQHAAMYRDHAQWLGSWHEGEP